MVTYYNKEEFLGVVTTKLVEIAYEKKADLPQEFSVIYFEKSPDVEYGIRGKAILKTSYNDNGYFIKSPQP